MTLLNVTLKTVLASATPRAAGVPATGSASVGGGTSVVTDRGTVVTRSAVGTPGAATAVVLRSWERSFANSRLTWTEPEAGSPQMGRIVRLGPRGKTRNNWLSPLGM